SPRQPSSRPRQVPPALAILRTTARMTAFKPGQSPPPVRRPTFILLPISKFTTKAQRAQRKTNRIRRVGRVFEAHRAARFSGRKGGPRRLGPPYNYLLV